MPYLRNTSEQNVFTLITHQRRTGGNMREDMRADRKEGKKNTGRHLKVETSYCSDRRTDRLKKCK